MTSDSRWSCQPVLGPAGSTCSITYSFADPQAIQTLNIGEFEVDGIRSIRHRRETGNKSEIICGDGVANTLGSHRP